MPPRAGLISTAFSADSTAEDVVAHRGGHYLADGQEAYAVPDDASLSDHPHGVKDRALDPASARRLWEVSTQLVAEALAGEQGVHGDGGRQR